MPVISYWNFDDPGIVVNDSETANGAQNGFYQQGAVSVGGDAVLDGCGAYVKLSQNETFQMDQGTLAIAFTLGTDPLTGTQTVLSRDSSGVHEGSFRVEILGDGSVVVSQETTGGTETYTTGPGFANPGDTINLSYSWDDATPGALVIDNLTSGDSFDAEVPADTTLDMGALSPHWVVGAGQEHSPAGSITGLDQNFQGTVAYFSLSDSVDNLPQEPIANPDAAETNEDVAVDINVLGNDSDPSGQPLTVASATAPNGSVTINPDGSLHYVPDADFNGTDTITYVITDPDGNIATSTVTVTVNPINDDPVAVDDDATTPQGVPVVIDLVGNDTDVDGDPLSLLGPPVSADGTIVVNPDGTVTFTPNPGFTGDATISYEVDDGNGGSATGTATVAVTPRDGIVTGTGGNDVIDDTYTGDPDGDVVDGLDAIIPGDGPNDDRIEAGGGDDTVLAGDGDDTVNGDDGSDYVDGGLGDDVIDTSGGGAAPLPDQGYPGLYLSDPDPLNDLDTVFGGAGNDVISTGDDADVVDGGEGNDLIDGGFDDDSLSGGSGNDTIIGAEGADNIDAGAGDDLVHGGYGPGVPDSVNIPDATDLLPLNANDNIFGGAGDDTIYGQDDDDTIDGGADWDLIYGGIDEDLITGGAGNDTITGGEGADSLSGGDDRDLFLGGDGGDAVDGDEGGDDVDTLDLRGSGPLRVIYDATNPENGTVEFLDADRNVTGSLDFVNIENVVPCFTPGTLIATPHGEIQVEQLRVGDKIITRDNGIQEIRWTGTRALNWAELRANPHLKPVLIRTGSLGNGLPERDMLVSPNHRMLVANDRTALYFDEHEVLVAAKHLVTGNGIHSVDSAGTTYLHFLFDRHEVVLANGAWTESFQPGDMTLKGMGNAQRSEIFDIFPELKTDAGVEGYTAARKTLKRHEALLLVK